MRREDGVFAARRLDFIVGAQGRLENEELSRGNPRERGLPATLSWFGLANRATGGALTKRLAPFWDDQEGLRLTILTRTARLDAVEALVERIESAANKEFPDVPRVVSGHFVMLIGTPGKLMDTMFSSLAVTVGVIALLFMIALRSFVLAIFGMIANVLPVVIVVGLMGWLGINADVATVMVGSIAFGLAVDDTFHYLYHRKKTGSIRRAAAIAGQGIVATTFMIAVGLSVLALSGFGPVVRFGLLTALGVLCALGIDAVVLPALVGESAKDSDAHPMTGPEARE